MIIYLMAEMLEECCEELHYVKDYYKKAKLLKSEHPDISRKYLTMAKTELEHANVLETMATNLYMSLSEECKAKIKEMYDEKIEECNNKCDKMSYLIQKISY